MLLLTNKSRASLKTALPLSWGWREVTQISKLQRANSLLLLYQQVWRNISKHCSCQPAESIPMKQLAIPCRLFLWTADSASEMQFKKVYARRMSHSHRKTQAITNSSIFALKGRNGDTSFTINQASGICVNCIYFHTVHNSIFLRMRRAHILVSRITEMKTCADTPGNWRPGRKRSGHAVHSSGVTESKESSNVIKSILGMKNLKAKLAERVFVEPYEIPLPAVSGRGQRVVHAN